MPLSHGYGVLRGTIQDYYRDDPDDLGRYYHGNLIVAAGGSYHCAIDVDSKQSNTGVEWRTFTVSTVELGPLTGLGMGFHPLSRDASSGAVDYVRSRFIAERVGCVAIYYVLIRRLFSISALWKRGTSLEALSDLEPLVNATRADGLDVFVLGEPFTSGLGVHNIHQNQGDPPGSTWAAENGIWQEGCTILQQSADRYAVFLNKFTSQSYLTDDLGHPAVPP